MVAYGTECSYAHNITHIFRSNCKPHFRINVFVWGVTIGRHFLPNDPIFTHILI